GRTRARAFLPRDARRTRSSQQHRDQSSQGQTRNAKSSDSRVEFEWNSGATGEGKHRRRSQHRAAANITRLWNGISAVALMRRGLALAEDYAQKRTAFGAPLSEKPLHLDTLAGLQAEAEAAFHLAFYVAELTGRSETGEISDEDAQLLRLLTPVMKLTTGKQAVSVASEVLESFGGAGYVEDTGLPVLLRDAQVLPIWEGTTNVLSLDLLRALIKPDARQALQAEFSRALANVNDARLVPLSARVEKTLEQAEAWLVQATKSGATEL